MLVARESAAPGGATGQLFDVWEPVLGPEAVQTPAEVYATLPGVTYLRVPVTDGRAPQLCDIDAIMRQVGSGVRGDVWRDRMTQ